MLASQLLCQIAFTAANNTFGHISLVFNNLTCASTFLNQAMYLIILII